MTFLTSLANELRQVVSRVDFSDADIKHRGPEGFEMTLDLVFKGRNKENVHGAGVAVAGTAGGGVAFPIPAGQSRKWINRAF